MNQPYPGGYPPHAQPGPYAQYGAPRRPSTAMAYVSAVLFLPAVALMYMSAITSIDLPESPFDLHMWVTMTGLAFRSDIAGNADAIIAVTFSYPSTVMLFVVLLFARMGFPRWIAAALGFLGFAYYTFAWIRFLADGMLGEYLIFPIVASLLWLIPSVVAVLPPTGRAMRGYRPQPPAVPPGYGPGHAPGYGNYGGPGY